MSRDSVSHRLETRYGRYRSSIPVDAIERDVSDFRSTGEWLRKAECLVGDAVVGERFYDKDGALLIERPLRNGQKHGVEFHWHDGGGNLESAEPFYRGLPHGTASQWDWDGTLLGTYTLNHGTGLDLWRMPSCSGGDGLPFRGSLDEGRPAPRIRMVVK
jgi:hypothetical protein